MKTSSAHHYRSPILSSASASAQHYYHHHHHHHHLLHHHHHYCPPVPVASTQQQRQRQAMVANSRTNIPMNSENNNYYYSDNNNSNFGVAATKSRTMDSLNYWKRAFGNPEQSMAGDVGLSERLIRIGGGAVGLVGGNICIQTGKCLVKEKKAVTNKLGCKYRAGALKMLSPIQNSSAFLDNPSPLLPMAKKSVDTMTYSGVDDKRSTKLNASEEAGDNDLSSLAEEIEPMINVPPKIEAEAVEKRQPSRNEEAEEQLFYVGDDSVNNYNEMLSVSSCRFSKQQEHRIGGGGKTGGGCGGSRYDDEDGTLVFAIEI